MFYGGIASFVAIAVVTRFRLSKDWSLKRNVGLFSILLSTTLVFSSLLSAPVVAALTPLPSDSGPNGSSAYKFSIPFTPYEWFIGEFRDGSYYAVNGSDWNIMTIVEPWQPVAPWASLSTDLAALTEQCLSVTSSGVVFLKQVPFDLALMNSIPENVKVACSYQDQYCEYINSADSSGSPYTVEVGAGLNDGYYIAKDSENRICFASTFFTSIWNSTLDVMQDGQTLNIGAGTFLIQSEEALLCASDAPNTITVRGQGKSSEFAYESGYTGQPFAISADLTGWTFERLFFNFGDTSDSGNSGFSLAANNCTIQECYFYGASHGNIDVIGDNNKVINNHSLYSRDDGIIVRGTGQQIKGNYVANNRDRNGISMVTCSNSLIAENHIQNSTAQHGIALEDLGDGPCDNVHIKDNFINDTYLSGVSVYSDYDGSPSAINCVIEGNTITYFAKTTDIAGIVFNSGYNCTVKDNTIAYSVASISTHGIWFTGTYDSNNDAVGNTIIGVDYGIYSQADYINIKDNKIIGAKINSICSRGGVGNIVENNVIENPVRTAIYFTGTSGSISGNTIYLTPSTIANFTGGIEVSPEGTNVINNLNIDNNRIISTESTAIPQTGPSFGIRLQASSGTIHMVAVDGNTIIGSFKTSALDLMSVTNATVVNNKIWNLGTNVYGIRETDSSDNNIIMHNTFANYTTISRLVTVIGAGTLEKDNPPFSLD
jgi:hypothetical protein